MGTKAISLSFAGSVTLDGHSYTNGDTESLDVFIFTREYANDIISDYESGSGVVTMVLDDGSSTTITPSSDNDTYTGWVQTTYNEWHNSDMTINQYDSNETGVVDNAENAYNLGGNDASYYASNTDLTNGLALKADKTNVLELDNTTSFTPDADYEPATKKYVDDSYAASGNGDMLKSVYDTNDNGKVDGAEDADKLGGELPAYYAVRDAAGTTGNITVLDSDGDAVDSGAKINDSGSSTSDIWTASQITSELADKIDTSEKASANGVATLGGDGKVPTSQLPDTILGGLQYKGTLDASGGSYPASPENGDYYVIDTAGTISGTVYEIGDWAVYNGSNWDKIDNTDQVASVNGKTGVVVLNTGDITTVTDKNYVTDAQLTKLNGIADGAEVNVQADWDETDNSSDAYIQNKPNFDSKADKVTGATDGNLAALDSNGNLTDSGFEVIDEDDFTSDSDTAVPTQQSVKAYVDASTAGAKITYLFARNEALGANKEIWAGGTSDGSVINPGWSMAFAGTIHKISVKMDGGASNSTLKLFKNNTSEIISTTTADAVSTNTGGGSDDTTVFEFNGLSVAAGDTIRIALSNWSNNPAATLILDID